MLEGDWMVMCIVCNMVTEFNEDKWRMVTSEDISCNAFLDGYCHEHDPDETE